MQLAWRIQIHLHFSLNITDKASCEFLTPFRWCAPECISDSKYSFKTDVWAYGVTLWEIFSFGVTPFGALSNALVCERILSGDTILDPPNNCSFAMWVLIQSCWNRNENQRPDFVYLEAVCNRLNRRLAGSVAEAVSIPSIMIFCLCSCCMLI